MATPSEDDKYTERKNIIIIALHHGNGTRYAHGFYDHQQEVIGSRSTCVGSNDLELPRKAARDGSVFSRISVITVDLSKSEFDLVTLVGRSVFLGSALPRLKVAGPSVCNFFEIHTYTQTVSPRVTKCGKMTHVWYCREV